MIFEFCIKLRCFFGFHYWERFVHSKERLKYLQNKFPVDVDCTRRECLFCDKLQEVSGYAVSDYERYLTFQTIKDETIPIL